MTEELDVLRLHRSRGHISLHRTQGGSACSWTAALGYLMLGYMTHYPSGHDGLQADGPDEPAPGTLSAIQSRGDVEDWTVPNVARIYDFLLGGAHNFAVDRDRGRALTQADPTIAAGAWGNRRFLRYAVQHALSLGIRQFLDLGSGIPTIDNVHEIAHASDAEARIAYVDHDPVAVAHTTTLLHGVRGVSITHADLRHPTDVLAAPPVAGLLDFNRPVALFTIAVLHFLAEDDRPASILASYRRAMAPGSILAFSHGSEDYPDHPEFVARRREVTQLYEATSDPVRQRSRAEITTMIEAAGFTLDPAGLRELGSLDETAHGNPLGGYAAITTPLPDRHS